MVELRFMRVSGADNLYHARRGRAVPVSGDQTVRASQAQNARRGRHATLVAYRLEHPFDLGDQKAMVGCGHLPVRQIKDFS